MEMTFNELSIQPLTNDKYSANDRMKLFAEAVKEARQQGFNIIRSNFSTNQINLAPDYSLYDWLVNNQIPQQYRDFLYGMISPPFINEEDEEIQEQYVESNYFFEDSTSNFTKTECLGLASAYLYETLSISFDSLPVWQNTQLQIIIEDGTSKRTGIVFNVYSKSSFNEQDIIEFIESISVVELQETDLNAADKNIHLADHHGKAELQILCNRLKNNPYVIEMRSMEFCNGRCNNFINKCYRDGKIEIVLYKTDSKYRLQVQTTGRNLRETEEIAEILNDRFS